MAIDVRPTLLDRAVAWFSPRAGAERLAGRAAISASTSMFGTGGYRGGQGDRQKRRGFFARGRSANADMIPGSDRLRAEQRDAAMNTPIAVAALGRMASASARCAARAGTRSRIWTGPSRSGACRRRG